MPSTRVTNLPALVGLVLLYEGFAYTVASVDERRGLLTAERPAELEKGATPYKRVTCAAKDLRRFQHEPDEAGPARVLELADMEAGQWTQAASQIQPRSEQRVYLMRVQQSLRAFRELVASQAGQFVVLTGDEEGEGLRLLDPPVARLILNPEG